MRKILHFSFLSRRNWLLNRLTGEWAEQEPMQFPRIGHACAALNQVADNGEEKEEEDGVNGVDVGVSSKQVVRTY